MIASGVVIGLGVSETAPVENLNKYMRVVGELICETGATIGWINAGSRVLEPGVFDDVTHVTVVDGETVQIGKGPLAIHSMRDTRGRFQGGHGVPTLNEREVLNIADDKSVFYDQFSDFVTPTYTVTTSSELADALDALPDGLTVLKPSKGSGGGKGVVIAGKAELLQEHGAVVEIGDEPMVVQKYLDNTGKMPGLVGLKEDDQTLLDTDGALKELRFFVINGLYIPVGKVALDVSKPGAGVYAFVDPDSVRQEDYQFAVDCTEKLRQESGVQEIFGAIDIAFDSTDMRPQAMEFNVRDPRLPFKSEVLELALSTRRELVSQLLRMAGV